MTSRTIVIEPPPRVAFQNRTPLPPPEEAGGVPHDGVAKQARVLQIIRRAVRPGQRPLQVLEGFRESLHHALARLLTMPRAKQELPRRHQQQPNKDLATARRGNCTRQATVVVEEQ
jgi:hypothetical protein